jgi:hypothetical protein
MRELVTPRRSEMKLHEEEVERGLDPGLNTLEAKRFVEGDRR